MDMTMDEFPDAAILTIIILIIIFICSVYLLMKRPDEDWWPVRVKVKERPHEEVSKDGINLTEGSNKEVSPDGVEVTEGSNEEVSPDGVEVTEGSNEEVFPDGVEVTEGSNEEVSLDGKGNSSVHSTLSPDIITEMQPKMKQYITGECGGKNTPAEDLEGVAVTEEIEDIHQSARDELKPHEEAINQAVPPPDHLTVDSVDNTSATVNWRHPPGLDQTHHHYQISYHCPGTEPHTTTTSTTSITLSDLRPATEYSVTVCTVMENGVQSQPVPVTLITKVPAPSDFTIEEQKSTSFTIRWTKGSGLDQTPQYFLISYSSPGKQPTTEYTDDCYRTLSDLEPGTQYTVSVSTVLTSGQESDPVSTTIYTVVPPPDHLTVDSVDTTSATVNWKPPPGLDQTHHHYQISYHCPGTEPHTTTRYTTNITLPDLRPATEYSVTVCTVMGEKKSQPVSITLITRYRLKELLSKAGLQGHYEGNKLTFTSVLEINADTTSDEPPNTLQSLPGAFLKKLMMANVNARSVKSMSTDQEVPYYGIENLDTDPDSRNVMNPLDLITAVFLCSDGILQQEMVQKMSMCQFAVPLLLPNCDTEQSTLMLWALRDIVKKFRPSSQTDSKAFVEKRIVVSDIPMISFVRIGQSSLSKTQILNKLLCNPQQYHDTFIHRDMECGDVPRVISDGLVEISWYFPCGNRNIDTFTEPVAVANLRGDIRSFEKQFYFLCQISAAVYIFSDDLEADFYTVLKSRKTLAEIFLVVNSQERTFRVETLKIMLAKSGIHERNLIVKKKQNDAEFVKALQTSVGDILGKHPNILNIKNMSKIACQIGILIDEDCEECQSASKMADAITTKIKDTVEFKDKHLPCQGSIWKKLSQLEKERCRLRNVGDQEIEHYKSSLKEQEKELREKQNRLDMSDAMAQFISGMSSSGAQRSYFLKWMRINLDDRSRQNLSDLRERYKVLCQNSPENKDDIALLDKQLSDCSLGIEHFLRELGQLYESGCSLPDDRPERKQMEQLPGLCAQMLLDGFPVELVDGDASNIPMKWISAVLTQLHNLVESNSKIRVVTVLGVQSTGKSTLLNTMFGVQFAVSSGRCTRGAFMLLLKVNKDLKKKIKCDFILVIDTEGLKSPELAQLDDSHEHDNELATLVIGLSDVTIINIAMENSTEMRDILQIVVHAFIRMKEVGKRPICHFVHQNVSDISAHDNNMRDRIKLLEQLDEMTKAAARMEKKENITKFTDVMDYDPDTSSSYIPGLWHGTPPMAPVNAGYSEAVYDFKKSVMQDFIKCQRNDDLTHFLEWTQSLWNAVKFEKFIFSFRNSLVADAYTRLCTEYNGWAWSFEKELYSWIVSAENKISNYGITNPNSEKSIHILLKDLIQEAVEKILLEGNKILDNVVKYFEKKDGDVSLVEMYKEDFMNSVKTLRRESENKVKDTLHIAVDIKEGMTKLDCIKSSQAETLEKKVLALLKTCRQKRSDLSDNDLKTEFQSMWMETLSEINFRGLAKRVIANDAFNMVRENLSRSGGHVNSMLVKNPLFDCGENAFVIESGGIKEKAGDFFSHWDANHHRKLRQEMCDYIIRQGEEFITQKVKGKTDYHDTYIKELLEMIDESLKQHKELKLTEENEASLKLHICGKAAREFQKMHDHFITVNDPKKCLEKFKNKYLMDFIDLFHKRDQCHKKAEDFTKLCLQPAVLDYVTKMIGPDVMDEMKTGKGSEDYSTRMSFQVSILKQLLIDGKYENYKKYFKNYEQFVKEWLFLQIVQQLSKERGLVHFEKKHLREIVSAITNAISNVRETTSDNIKTFIQNICDALGEKLVFPKDSFDSIMILNNANIQQFANYLTEFVREMEQSLAADYEKGGDIVEKLQSLPFKPQDKMFTSLFGCGEQCPFCNVPCEAGGAEHEIHFTSIHRPQGVSGRHDKTSRKLVTDICSSAVVSDKLLFSTSKTRGEFHPYKDYQKYYPDWNIAGDSSIEASNYWKYVMATFHQEIAKDHNLNPADIPIDWIQLTRKQAMKSLMESFNISDSNVEC